MSLWQKIRKFEDFPIGNDPYREHDFGTIEHEETKVFWKIDYYDPQLEYGSEDPADPEQTCRVLLIMLPSDY